MNHALGTQLFKSFSERNTQTWSHLEQKCVYLGYVAVNEELKTTLNNLEI